MTELNIVEIAVAVLAVVSLVEIITINRISRNLRETEKMVSILLKDKIKVEMVEMADKLRQGLENLFNPKDEPKNNVKKTNTKRKTK